MRLWSVVCVVSLGGCSELVEKSGGVEQQVADPSPTLSISSVAFSNAVGGTDVTFCGPTTTACTAAPTAQVRWGTPAYTTDKSGLGFEPSASQVLAYGSDFSLGTLTHFNFPTISGTWASGATLEIGLAISGSSGPILSTATPVSIPFTIDETPNEEPCAYASTTPCDDRVTFGTAVFNLGAASATTQYNLNISGFVTSLASTTPLAYLQSEEYMSTSAVLKAQLTESCIDVDLDSICDENDFCIGTDEECADPCPCDAAWKNHGEYVSCVAHAANDLVAAGKLDENGKGAMVSAAGQSSCGK